MLRIYNVILAGGLLISACEAGVATITPTTYTPIPVTVPTITPTVSSVEVGEVYYVSSDGSDVSPGTFGEPWQTIQKAVDSIKAGDTVYIRGGQYDGVQSGWSFENSGTQSEPITITNYPGEQVILKILIADRNDQYIFRCSINPNNPESWQTSKADYIKILGTNVSPRLLPNGVESQKGIVMLGLAGAQSAGIVASDCDYWEVAGVDFVETASGIFTEKNNWSQKDEHSTDFWHVHDNRVYNYYRESGMQFNGNFNLIENNEIYKVSDRLDTPHGCQMLNLLGNNNTVRGNTLSRLGSTAACLGILFEWDLADANLVEQNHILDVDIGIAVQGGDGNIFQNNEIVASPIAGGAGFQISSYDKKITWPCNDYAGSGSSAEALLPPDDQSHPDYIYYYGLRNCHSMNNKIINNEITGFRDPWIMYPVAEDSNVFSSNLISQP